jgi:hypothetical protein
VKITKPKAKVKAKTPNPETLEIRLVDLREIEPATDGTPAPAHRVPGLEERRAGAGGDAGRGQPPVRLAVPGLVAPVRILSWFAWIVAQFGGNCYSRPWSRATSSRP